MKRYCITLIALAVFLVLAFVYSDTRPAIGQQPRTTRDVNSRRATADITETPKGKVLVEKLPEGVDGVVLEKGVVKARPGYKLVKKDKQVMAMPIGGGDSGGSRGIGGSWQCNCAVGGGGCEVVSDENAVFCRKAGTECSDKCMMSITIKGVKSRIIQY